MENNKFKSLAQQLIQDGILSQNLCYDDEIANLYDIKSDENIENSPFAQKPEENNNPKDKKRINQYDINMLDEISKKNNCAVLEKLCGKSFNFRRILLKIFPRLYKAKLVKEAMKKLSALNINADTLREKTIPYGENELRYGELVKYLNCANEIQQNLNEKFN